MSYFSDTYVNSRQKVKDISCSSKLGYVPYFHTQHFDNTPLSTDLIISQSSSTPAEKAFILSSGVHGIEGFYGAALQAYFLDNLDSFSDQNCDVFIIHAVNPFGFTHLRRVNEDNIDVNRNFIDFDRPLPQNHAYESYNKFFNPQVWGSPEHQSMLQQLQKMIADQGMQKAQEDISKGQYTCPQGLFFGGTASTRSREILEEISKEYLSKYKQLALIDVHTGLGDSSEISLLHDAAKLTPGYQVAQKWYDGEIIRTDQNHLSADICGSMGNFLPTIPGFTVSLTLEVGTVPPMQIFENMLAENWFFRNSASAEKQFAKSVKKDFRECFYPDSKAWEKNSLDKGLAAVKKIYEGLRNTR